MRQAQLIGPALTVFAAGSAAVAETVSVAPDPCPAPAEAAYYDDADAEAADLNPWRDLEIDGFLFRDEIAAGGRLRQRVFVDPETGQPLISVPADAEDCPTAEPAQ